MLGHDVARMLDEAGIRRVYALLAEQADPEAPAPLPADLNPRDPDRARALLYAMLAGMLKCGQL